MKKRFLSFIALVTLTVLSVCALSIVAGAEGTPSVSVDKFNLVFEDNTYLKYGVKFDGVDDEKINSSNIGMLYFTAPQGDYTAGGEAYSSSVVGYKIIDDQKYYTFEYRHINAKQMTDYVYSVAYIDLDGERYYSVPVKYSVLEYCYSKLGITGEASDSASFKKLLSATLEQGAAAQEFFGYRTDRLANACYYQVNVVGGTLEDGSTSGLYQATETATLTAPETNGELAFAGWQNSYGTTVTTDNPAYLTGFMANQTYTASYDPTVDTEAGVEALAYTVNQDGTTCTITGIGGCTDTVIYIPDYMSEYKVTAVGESAFADCTDITYIKIPDTVTNIGSRAFYGCSGITEITIPESVINIGTQVFYKAENLSTVYYNSSYTGGDRYGNNSNPFLNLSHINKVVFGNKNSIPSSILSGCSNIEEIIISDGITRIDCFAFDGCSIESITIPDSVEYIDVGAFDDCLKLKCVYVSNLASYCSINFVAHNSTPTINGADLYLNGTLVTDVAVPSGISALGYMFEGCTSIKKVIIPNTVSTIKEQAFEKCISLESVVIPDSVTSIGNEAFHDCDNLTSMVIPDSVTSIGYQAFQNCYNLTNVVIGNGVINIGRDAFSYCNNLTSVVIGNSVTTIESCAFLWCTSLAEVYYTNSKEEWTKISISDGNSALTDATRYYYSETAPTEEGNFWHYDENGEVAVWPEHQHTWSEWDEAINDTGISVCEWGPTYIRTCSSCGEIEARIESAPGHKELTLESVPATCTQAGLSEGKYCTVCQTTTVEQQVIDALGHNYVDYVCSLCNKQMPGLFAEDGSLVASWEDLTNVYGLDLTAKYDLNSVHSLSYSPYNVFKNYTELSNGRKLVIEEGITEIGDWTFNDCPILTEIVIPEGVTSIGMGAFLNTKITKITIPKSVIRVEQAIFNNRIEAVYISDIAVWCGIDFEDNDGSNPLSLGAKMYLNGNLVTELIIPNGVTKIGSYAFDSCSQLTSVVIPDTVTSIGDGAFSDCDGLTEISIPSSVTSIGNDAFYACNNLICKKFDNAYYLGNDSNPYHVLYKATAKDITSCVIRNNVVVICSSAFTSCTGLTQIIIPGTAVAIGDYAFSGCTALNSVTIPTSVTSIGNYAFEDCTAMYSITIPTSVTSIGDHAFKDCIAMYSITISTGVTSIGNDAFTGCTGLKGVYINDLEKWCNIEFGYGASNPLYYAKKLYLNNSLVTDLVIPNTVTDIGEYAFYGCTSITSVVVSDGVTSIEFSAFKDCTSLTSVTIPNSVTSIAYYAFSGCTSLTSVVIPDSVTKIWSYAFNGCTALTNIYYTGTEEEWTTISVGTYNTPLTNATIHYNYTPEE